MRARWPSLCLALAAVLTLAPEGAQAKARGLRHLKTWAGEYVIPLPGYQRRSIFADPQLRAALARLLEPRELRELVARFEATAPAELASGLLIFSGNPEHDAPHACLVIVGLDSGDVWVAMRDGAAVTWFGPKLPPDTPTCLIEDFLPRR
jgi:hypothetical protein